MGLINQVNDISITKSCVGFFNLLILILAALVGKHSHKERNSTMDGNISIKWEICSVTHEGQLIQWHHHHAVLYSEAGRSHEEALKTLVSTWVNEQSNGPDLTLSEIVFIRNECSGQSTENQGVVCSTRTLDLIRDPPANIFLSDLSGA